MKSPRVFATLVALAFGWLLQLDIHCLAFAVQSGAVRVVAVRQHQRPLAHKRLTATIAFLQKKCRKIRIHEKIKFSKIISKFQTLRNPVGVTTLG